MFRIIDNVATELGDFKTDSITKSTALNPKLKGYGENAFYNVKKRANSNPRFFFKFFFFNTKSHTT